MATKPTKSTKSKTSTRAKATSAGRRRSSTKSTSAGTSRSKAAPVSAAAPKPKAAPETAAPAPAASAASGEDERVRRPDMIEAVSARVSVKRSEVKMVMDVFLDELGKALDGSDDVVLPPLGKLMVKKRADQGGNTMLTLKLKRADTAPEAGDVTPLAKSGEEG